MEARSLIRFFMYILLKLLTVFIVILLAFFVYNCAKETFNVNLMVKDAVTKRATALLTPEYADEKVLERMFTERYIDDSRMMNQTPENYTIDGFNQTVAVDYAIVWSWQTTAELIVTDTMNRISAEYKEGDGSPDINDIYTSGRYRVKLIKDKEQWKIYDIELLERIYTEPTATPAASLEA